MVAEGKDKSVDPFDYLTNIYKGLDTISASLNINKEASVESILLELRRKRKTHNGSGGLLSGFDDLDEITGGFQNGDSIVIAGRPSMGKTALVLILAKNIACNHPVAFFSLEMPKSQLVQRLESQHSGISLKRIMRNQIFRAEEEKLYEADIELADLKLYVDDQGGISPLELRAKAIRMKKLMTSR